MTRRVSLGPCARVLSVAIALALSIAACTSDDGAAPAADASVDAIAIDLCSVFTSDGAECPAVSRTVCFAECKTGGCSCVATGAGPRWKCVTDLSCVPDAGPLDFDAHVNEPDATQDSDGSGGSDGAADGGAGDAGDASDASDAADARDDAPG